MPQAVEDLPRRPSFIWMQTVRNVVVTFVATILGLWLVAAIVWWGSIAWLNQPSGRNTIETFILKDLLHRPQWHLTFANMQGHWDALGPQLFLEGARLSDEKDESLIAIKRGSLGVSLWPLLNHHPAQLDRVTLEQPFITLSPPLIAAIKEVLLLRLPPNPLSWWVDPLFATDAIHLSLKRGRISQVETLLTAPMREKLQKKLGVAPTLAVWPNILELTLTHDRMESLQGDLSFVLGDAQDKRPKVTVKAILSDALALSPTAPPNHLQVTVEPISLKAMSPWVQGALKAQPPSRSQNIPPWVANLHTEGWVSAAALLTGPFHHPIVEGQIKAADFKATHPRLRDPLLLVPSFTATVTQKSLTLPQTAFRYFNQLGTLAIQGDVSHGTVLFNSPRVDLDQVMTSLKTLDPTLVNNPSFPSIKNGKGSVALTLSGPWQALQPSGKGSWAIEDFKLPFVQDSKSSSTPRPTQPLLLQAFKGTFTLLPRQWALSQVSAQGFKGSISGKGTMALARPFTLPPTNAALKAFQNNGVTGDIIASHVDVQALLAAVPEATDTLKASGISPYQAGTVDANLHIHGKLNQVFQSTSQTTSSQGLQGIQGVSGVITLSGSEWQTPWGRLSSDAFRLILGPNGLLFQPLASVKEALLHFRLDDIPIALSGEWRPNDPLPTGKLYVSSVPIQTLLRSPLLANTLSTVGPLPVDLSLVTGNVSLYGERNTNSSLQGKLSWETLQTTSSNGHTATLQPGSVSLSGKSQGDIPVTSSPIALRVSPPIPSSTPTETVAITPYPAALLTGQLSGTLPWGTLNAPKAKNPPIRLATQWSVAPEGHPENPLQLDSQWLLYGPVANLTKVETPNTRLTLWGLGDMLVQGQVNEPFSNNENKRWVVASISTPNRLSFQDGVQDALLPWYPADIQAQLLSQKSTAKALAQPSQGTLNTQLAFVGNGKDTGMLMGQLAVNNLSLPLVDLTQLNGTVTYNGLDAQVALDKITLPGADLSVKAHIVDYQLYPVRLDDMVIDGGQFSVPALQYWVENVLDKRINQALMQPLMAAWQPQAAPNNPIALATPTATPDLSYPSPPPPPLAPLPIVFENAKLSIKEVVYDNILIDDVTGTLSLFESGFFDLHQAHGTVANGTVDASLSMDPLKNNFTRVTLNAHQLSSNALLTALLKAPNQVFGNVDGQIRFTTEGATPEAQMDATNGTVTFTLADGRVPAIARIEKLLIAVNVLRGGVLGLSANNLLRLASPFKTEYIANMSGTLKLLEGMATTDDVLSDGADLDLLTEGTMRLKDGESDLTVYGDMSQSVRGRLGRVGKFSLLNVVRWVPGVGYFPWERNRQKLGGLLAYVPGVGFVPFLGGPLGDRQRFEVRLKGLLDSPTVVESFQWAP
ncbi:MAG: AsmA family protein [Vampirovibrionales bacterium]|nr:AsmA family protein [Vampirovibrionales bacterium]